jgi:hypothetical protein
MQEGCGRKVESVKRTPGVARLTIYMKELCLQLYRKTSLKTTSGAVLSVAPSVLSDAGADAMNCRR